MLEDFIKYISNASRQYLFVNFLLITLFKATSKDISEFSINHNDFQINKLRISIITGKRKFMKIQIILVPLILSVFNFLILDTLNF